jgi:hypothetical protein
MAEREKVIKGLELCKQDAKLCFSETECPYQCEFPRCCLKLMADTLELLKERDEVVRCKDCKHWEQQTGHCPYNSIFTHSEWFCADGERKKGR